MMELHADSLSKGHLVCLSGGMDSTVLLADVLKHYDIPDAQLGHHGVFPFGFNYGQRHAIELNAARDIAEHYELAFDVVYIPVMQQLQQHSALTNLHVPVPKQADLQQIRTVVPYRNAMLIMQAVYVAVHFGLHHVWIGAVAEDYPTYRDCRPEFFDAINSMLKYGSVSEDDFVTVHAPFVHMSKAAVVHLGESLQVPWELTYTCYNGQRPPCGECDACKERQAAFAANGIEDPLLKLGESCEGR